MTMKQHDAYNYVEDPFIPVPIPPQAPAQEGTVKLKDTHIWCWDTGGSGEPIVLVHPASGSGLIWSYQQPVFAAAGYRVIVYSRRGHHKSGPIDEKNPGTGAGDLHGLVEHLKLDKFHLLGSAAGGSVVADYAFSHMDKLITLTVSSNSVGQRSGYITDHAARCRPAEWDPLPVWFRELSPGYRGANPEGTKKWTELEKIGPMDHDLRQNMENKIDPKKLETLTVPTLLLVGACDMSTPSSLLRMVAKHVPNNEWLVASEAGHSFYWERPELFNRVVLDFLKRHPKR
jgi:pimeloyl-ACP methyl ester carboxylesterase